MGLVGLQAAIIAARAAPASNLMDRRNPRGETGFPGYRPVAGHIVSLSPRAIVPEHIMGKFTVSPIRKSSTTPAKTARGASPGLYERDCYAWSIEQAKALRERRFADLDIENLAEEIEDVGKSEYRALESALTVLLMHLLKWDHQPSRRSRSWEATVRDQRRSAIKTLSKNPSLQSKLDELVRDAYESARDRASGETDLPVERFPEVNPYDWPTMMERPIEFDRDRDLAQGKDR